MFPFCFGFFAFTVLLNHIIELLTFQSLLQPSIHHHVLIAAIAVITLPSVHLLFVVIVSVADIAVVVTSSSAHSLVVIVMTSFGPSASMQIH